MAEDTMTLPAPIGSTSAVSDTRLELDDIQGIVLSGYGKLVAASFVLMQRGRETGSERFRSGALLPPTRKPL